MLLREDHDLGAKTVQLQRKLARRRFRLHFDCRCDALEPSMAQLTVRNVDDDVAAALKARAAKSGRSAEAEHRKILEEALRPRGRSDFFEEARARRIKLPAGSPETTELLRQDRHRNDA